MKRQKKKPFINLIAVSLSCMLCQAILNPNGYAISSYQNQDFPDLDRIPVNETDFEHERTLASAFLNSYGIETQGLEYTQSTDALVCFSNEQHASFCIVARKDYETCLDSPILAYSFNFPLWTGSDNESGTTMSTVLERYTIRLKELHRLSDSIHNPSHSGSVAPLLGTMSYGQKTSFNNYFPLENNQGKLTRCVAGCGSVALAQLLSYHKYPEKTSGHGVITTTSGKRIEIDMEQKEISWNRIRPDIPRLMLDCAASLYTHAGPLETTSSIDNFKPALINNWGYSPQCMTIDGVTDSELLNDVYSELEAGRPVIVANGSHIFICDGYEGDYLHLNWGWNGYCNGYYRAVITDSSSIGQLPFQYILVGIKPFQRTLSATIRVDRPGSLSRMIDNRTAMGITSLTVYGTLNGTDIKFLRRMAGASDAYGEPTDIGSLMFLDLSEANIVTGLPYATFKADGYMISGTATDRDSGEFQYRYNLSDINDSIWKRIVDHKLDNRGDMLLRRDSDGQIYISYYALDNVIGKRMFSGCLNLRGLTLPKATQKVDEEAFLGCRSLEAIHNLPERTVDSKAFNGCIRLRQTTYFTSGQHN